MISKQLLRIGTEYAFAGYHAQPSSDAGTEGKGAALVRLPGHTFKVQVDYSTIAFLEDNLEAINQSEVDEPRGRVVAVFLGKKKSSGRS